MRLDHLLSRNRTVLPIRRPHKTPAIQKQDGKPPRRPLGDSAAFASSVIDGAIAQLGEHLLCKQGVVGSIPTGSTSTSGTTTTDPDPAARAVAGQGRPAAGNGARRVRACTGLAGSRLGQDGRCLDKSEWVCSSGG